jgi:AraC-like DNA-binding protein
MHSGPTPRLLGHRLVQTRDPDEACAWLHAWGIGLDVAARDARQFSMCLNGVSLPNMSVSFSYVYYGARVSVTTTEANRDYWVLPPICGALEGGTGKSEAAFGPDRAFVMSPLRSSRVRSQERSARLSLRLTGTALTRQLVALLGEPLNAPLELMTELKLGEGYGRSIIGYVHQTIADYESGGSMLGDPATANAFGQFIMTALLLCHPHNYSDALRRLEKQIAPRDVRRAIDYIEANLDSVITLADIVAASRVPGRTLFKHFKDHRGISPMHYLRTARLKKVREWLQRAEPEQEIAEVAMRWQIEHMGRFALEYRKRFGESPSETLRGHTTRPRTENPRSPRANSEGKLESLSGARTFSGSTLGKGGTR